jgi:hypothetical protein
MKERPILFQGAMVRALLDGSKTQTRRICKQQPYSNGHGWDGHDIMCHNDYLPPSAMLMDAGGKALYTTSNLEGWESECPYGQPGDRLWVRETFVHIDDEGDKFDGMGSQTYYRASCMDEAQDTDWLHKRGLKWTPSIHMHRKYSRIMLEIVSVRVEQLNDCIEADAIAEGVLGLRSLAWDRLHFPVWRYQFDEAVAAGRKPPIGPSPAQAYAALWDSINGAGSWSTNPWVWVVEFRRLP